MSTKTFHGGDESPNATYREESPNTYHFREDSYIINQGTEDLFYICYYSEHLALQGIWIHLK